MVFAGGVFVNYEAQYKQLLQKILDEGEYTEDRTGTGCYSLFGEILRHDLSNGFPLLTSKKMFTNNIFGELLWFLNGRTDLSSLRRYQNKDDCAHTIWSDDFAKYHEVTPIWQDVECRSGGAIYGKQWRNFERVDFDGEIQYHDQIKTLIKNIIATKKDPSHKHARRLIATAWHPWDHTEGDKMAAALPACHTDFQCLVRDGKLNLRFSMRSNDMFLGNPYNMASYALLCHILAKITGLEVGELVCFITDCHLYSNHIEQAKELLDRDMRGSPALILPEFDTLDEVLGMTGQDFKVEGYNPHGFIKAPQAS